MSGRFFANIPALNSQEHPFWSFFCLGVSCGLWGTFGVGAGKYTCLPITQCTEEHEQAVTPSSTEVYVPSKARIERKRNWDKDRATQTVRQQLPHVTNPGATPTRPARPPVPLAREPDAAAWKNLVHSLLPGSCDCCPKSSDVACWDDWDPSIPLQFLPLPTTLF